MKRTDVHQAAILHSPPDDAVRRSLRRCDAGANTFAQSCIGYADRGGLEHPRVLVENLFDFARIDVGPAADNRLFLAIDNFQITFCIKDSPMSPIRDPALVRYFGPTNPI